MKKILMTMAALFLLGACGGNKAPEGVEVTRATTAPTTTQALEATTVAQDAQDTPDSLALADPADEATTTTTTTTAAPAPVAPDGVDVGDVDLSDVPDLQQIVDMMERDLMQLTAAQLMEWNSEQCTVTEAEMATSWMEDKAMIMAFFGPSMVPHVLAIDVAADGQSALVTMEMLNADGDILWPADPAAETDGTWLVEDGQWRFLDDECQGIEDGAS